MSTSLLLAVCVAGRDDGEQAMTLRVQHETIITANRDDFDEHGNWLSGEVWQREDMDVPNNSYRQWIEVAIAIDRDNRTDEERDVESVYQVLDGERVIAEKRVRWAEL